MAPRARRQAPSAANDVVVPVPAEKIRIAPALRWVLLGRGAQVLTQLLGVSILARLVSPADFGLLALAGVATALLRLLLDMGTATAVVQKANLAHAQVNSIFWFNLLTGTVLGTALLVFSPWIAFLLGDGRVRPVLGLLALAFPITALGATQIALLERESQFKRLAIQGSIAGSAGLTTAIVLALNGFGVYALVAQSIVAALLSTGLAWRASGWKAGRPSMRGLDEIAGFSGNLLAFNLLNYLHRNSDTVIIGRVFGQGDLGIYNVAYRILLFPLQNITFAINKAMLPAYSKRQLDHANLREHYLLTLRGIALVTAPLMTSVWWGREPIVALLLGPSWAKAGPIIAWLAPVGFLQSILSTSGSVLTAIGKTTTLRKLGVVGVPFLTVSFLAGIPWGVQGLAASYCLANVIWIFPVFSTVMRSIGGTGRAAISEAWLPAAIAVASFLVAHLLVAPVQAPPVTRLAGLLVLGAALYALGVALFLRRECSAILEAIMAPRAPRSRVETQ
jgi:PST family polysaccharide transporter